MHLFATTTAEQVLEIGKAAAFVRTDMPARARKEEELAHSTH
jgi:hypothetical protein